MITEAAVRAHTTVCVAGPGSGKTRTLVERVQDLVREGHDPSGFVLITYTNTASDELRSRCLVKAGFIGTLHAFMLRVLREHGEAIGFTEQVQVVSQDQADSILDDLVQEHRYKGTKKALEEAMAAGPEVGKRAVMRPEEILAAAFFRALKRSNLVSFDTLLHYGAKLAGRVGGYSHLFVDEAQDSSDVDFQIYRALPIPVKYFMGDPDQSIYSFRGGRVTHLVGAVSEASEVIQLERNFRCDHEIATSAQRLIEHNTNRIAKRTVSVTGLHGLARFTKHDHPGAEMQAVSGALTGRTDLDTCAVLLRTNHLVGIWRDYLKDRGIPVRERKAVQRPKDWRTAVALLGMLADPSNDMQAYWAASLLFGQPEAMARKRRAIATSSPLAAMIHPSPWGATLESVTGMIAGLVTPHSMDLLRSIRDKMSEDATIQDLCLRIAETEAAEAEEGKGVTICTKHAAKGREWTAVWLPCLTQDTIPGDRKSVDVEEERRLMYVAMTRAKHELWMSSSSTPVPRWDAGKKSAVPSQFVSEAGFVK